MKKILIVLLFSLASFANTLFIEGIDNKFMCDGKQSSGGGFQKCKKVTALKPMTLCFSSPSGMKCKKLQANETLDTEVDTNLADNSKDEKQKNSSVKNDTPKAPIENTNFDNIEVKTEVNVQNKIASINFQDTPIEEEPSKSINLASLFNLNTVATSENGTGLYETEYLTIFKYTEPNIFEAIIAEDEIALAPGGTTIVEQVKHFRGELLTDYLLEKTNSTTYVFNGGVRGSVITASNTIEKIIEADPSNELIMNFDFGGGSNSMNGTLKFQTANTSWDTTLSSNISANDFTASINSGATNVNTGSLYGKFVGDTQIISRGIYKDTITDIAGNFTITDDSNNQAYGLFSATNSLNDIPTLDNYTLNGYRTRIILDNGNMISEVTPLQLEKEILYDLDDNPLQNADSSWGYWNETQNNDSVIEYIHIKGLLSNNSIMNDILDINATNQRFTFEGGVIGSVATPIIGDVLFSIDINGDTIIPSENIESIITDATNSLQMNFDLGGGTNSMTGTMAFTTATSSWDVNLSSSHAQISNSGFSGNITSGDTIVTSGSLEGKFYGRDSLQSVGGKFNITNSNGDLAAGVFRALK